MKKKCLKESIYTNFWEIFSPLTTFMNSLVTIKHFSKKLTVSTTFYKWLTSSLTPKVELLLTISPKTFSLSSCMNFKPLFITGNQLTPNFNLKVTKGSVMPTNKCKLKEMTLLCTGMHKLRLSVLTKKYLIFKL